jgi:O-antigen biosynthesis protein
LFHLLPVASDRVRRAVSRIVHLLLPKTAQVNSSEHTASISPANNPLISVVIPIYDRTRELIESIESILHQTYQHFELLLVTDGSPEETIAVVERYRNNPKVRIFLYPTMTGNAVRGRNTGIKEAKGEFIAFHDSDDVAEPTRLKDSLEYIEKYNADVVYGGWRALVDGSRKDIEIVNGQEIFSPEVQFDALKESNIICQSTVMARRSALLAVGGFKPKMRYREDHELWLRLSHFGYKFKAIPAVLTNLRLHSGNNELNFKHEDAKWKKLALEEYTLKSRL